MKASLFSLPDAHMTYAEAVYFARATQTALEPFPRAEFLTPDEDAAKRLGDLCAETGVAISCFSMLADFSSEDIAPEIDRVKAYARVAAAMGSPYLHHTLMPTLDAWAASVPFDWALQHTAGAAREIAEYAAGLGVTCLYEEQGFVFNGCERFAALLDALGPQAGVVADLGNIYFVDETPEAFVRRFAGRVKHVHAKDYLLRGAQREFPGEEWYRTRAGNYLRGASLGCGEVPFREILRTLAVAGYDGYYSLEYDGPVNGYESQRISLRNLHRYADAVGV